MKNERSPAEIIDFRQPVSSDSLGIVYRPSAAVAPL